MDKRHSQPSFLRRIGHTLERLVFVYGLLTLLLLTLWKFTGEVFFPVNMFVNLLPAAFYLAPILLIGSLLAQRWRLVGVLIPVMLAFAGLYGHTLLPKAAPPPSTAPEITVLTYNIFAGNRRVETIERVIEEADADIVAVQEANQTFIAHAETYLSVDYPYIAYYRDEQPSQYEGRMILSRYPIVATQIVPGYARTVLYLRAEIDVDGTRLAVYSVHLHPPAPYGIFSTEARSGDMQQLLDNAARDPLPVIMLGDFNMTDMTADSRRISATYTDAFRATATGLGTSHPNGRFVHPRLTFFPGLIRIDYVFHDDYFTPLEARVIRDGTSDHYPLWARLRLGKAPNGDYTTFATISTILYSSYYEQRAKRLK